MKKIMVMWFIVLLLGGCASGITRSPGVSMEMAKLTTSNQVAAVTISMTDEARKKSVENLKFNPDELLNHVKRALEANALLNATTDVSRPTLEIRVKDMRVRSNFSAVMFGFMAGADSITGDIIVKNPTGQEIDKFEVSVSYALGGLAGGEDSARMGWLYEKFAEETVKELTKER
ncbi:MAG: DUF4410 domain-containing protein [Nitrospirae bacterium]|nr:DUF4410 domain-containing protein [Nitrospirota bacterium]